MSKHFLLSLFFFASAILFSSCYLLRAYKFRNFELNSHEKLPSVSVQKGPATFVFANATAKSDYARLKTYLDTMLVSTETAAFLVIRNDSILYENYFNGFSAQSLLPSFSVAKSFVSTLVCMAHEEGKIKSLHEPVTVYIPELLKNDRRFADITIQHLLDMRSGIQWNENDYGLKDDAVKLGFRPNMMKYIMKIKIAQKPSEDSDYKSINTMLLGIIVSRVTKQPLSKYLQQKIWQPLGMENNATWNTDKHGLEITYGGLNATARDFAKLGRLYLNKGKWEGDQLFPEKWVYNTVSADSMGFYEGYRNQWWGTTGYRSFKDSAEAVKFQQTTSHSGKVNSYINPAQQKMYFVSYRTAAYYAEGILGQFVYVHPEKKLIIVRLGHYWQHKQFGNAEGFIQTLANEL